MRRLLALIGGWIASLVPAALAGGFYVLAIARLTAAAPPNNRVATLLFGALYGVGVAGLVRLFRVRAWARPVAGLICGPVPFALLPAGEMRQGDREGMLLLTAVLGLLIGLLEAARVARASRAKVDGDAES